jgi:hypothetical protein
MNVMAGRRCEGQTVMVIAKPGLRLLPVGVLRVPGQLLGHLARLDQAHMLGARAPRIARVGPRDELDTLPLAQLLEVRALDGIHVEEEILRLPIRRDKTEAPIAEALDRPLVHGCNPSLTPSLWGSVTDRGKKNATGVRFLGIFLASFVSNYLARLRGYSPDKPRSLAKSVTVK